ncbi:YhgE/Pip domain-containing protein [Virgibacillus ndiopensis]|uniref:YhgE/Pip domain-containing protein n=1 Tax=Virgibacillus ndiopensis TaxID=2004408 RepID=UPI00159BAD53|nr:YhgE/Pip domain-containing protein [Virgibacillus ndiopensis]
MKNILRIFKTDGKNIGTNWVAAILIGGLIILPSFYAWFNIKASWDPYSQTDQIPVGVVNEDQGAMVRDQKIQVGDDLVKKLQKNDDMDWQFVDRKEAMDKVDYGDYFAVIIIPENFSEKLSTVISDNPKKATVEYYVNEKINAIAPKITEKGASVIVEQISSNFVSTVNGVIFDLFNNLGIELETGLPDIKQFEDYIFTIEKNLPEIHDMLNESLTDATNVQGIINKAQGLVPEAEQVTNDGLATIDKTTDFLNKAENRLNEMAPQIKKDLKKVSELAASTNKFISRIQRKDINFKQGEEITGQLNDQVNEQIKTIETIEQALRNLQEQNNNNQDQNSSQQGTIDNTLKQLATLKNGLKIVQENTKSLSTFIGNKKQKIDQMLADLQQLTQDTHTKIDAFVKEYKERIEPTVLNEVAKAKNTLANAKGILTDIQQTIPQVKQIITRTDENLSEGKEKLESISGEFPYVSNKINQLADRIRNIQRETDINEIIELLENDPEAERSFFAEPVELNENKLYPIPNYGSGMTPFYTTLAIWVGALLLISLLSVEVVGAESLTSKQIYFGRFLTFMSIGLLQTFVVTIGDIALLDVYINEASWFILFGLLISTVFMSIVYTLVSVFGDVGKALAIILLVLQIAAAGGTYPVVLLPEFFQAMNPFLPFTYAIDLMREAVGGIVWDRALKDIMYLVIFGIAALLLGSFLKKTINKKTNVLMKKSKESGLFH